MNFLFDENLPPRLARALRELGEPVRHVIDIPDLGKGATDAEIISYAAEWERSSAVLGGHPHPSSGPCGFNN